MCLPDNIAVSRWGSERLFPARPRHLDGWPGTACRPFTFRCSERLRRRFSGGNAEASERSRSRLRPSAASATGGDPAGSPPAPAASTHTGPRPGGEAEGSYGSLLLGPSSNQSLSHLLCELSSIRNFFFHFPLVSFVSGKWPLPAWAGGTGEGQLSPPHLPVQGPWHPGPDLPTSGPETPGGFSRPTRPSHPPPEQAKHALTTLTSHLPGSAFFLDSSVWASMVKHIL